MSAARVDNGAALLAQDAVLSQPVVARPVFHAIEGDAVSAEVFVPALASVLAQPTTAPEVVGGAPLLDSQVGNVFHDAGDGTLIWHLPSYELAPDPDVSFAFDARQDVADDHGHPYNTATLTFAVHQTVPADATAALNAQPGSRVQQIPVVATDVTLNLAFKGPGGDEQIQTIPGSASPTADGLLLTFTGLVGDKVILAFTDLTTTAAASVSLTLTYVVDDVVPRRRFVKRRQIPVRRRPARLPDQIGVPVLDLFPVDDIPDDDPAEPPTTTIRRSTTTTIGVPIGAKFAGSSYRSRYTVASDGATRAIVNTDDLERFNVVQSEFQELTALGDVASRYPSLRALYIGLVSGTVVAVPAAYGIQRTPLRCEAACDALVDSGSAMSTGCRFHLSFTVTPVVDPGDLVRLSADLRLAPTLPSRDWKIVLPSDLDRRTQATFASPFVNAMTFGVGTDPNTFTVGADILDDTMPAIVKVNAFLKQLAATGPAPLFGRLPVRLDDAHTPPVEANLVLDLHTTGGDQELIIDNTQPGTVSMRNVAPYDVRLANYTSQTAEGFLTAPLDQVLAAGATTTLTLPSGAQVLTVHRGLSLPDPTPPAVLANYVTFRTTDVQRVHHLLGVNATSVLAGSPDDAVTALSVTITLTSAPDVVVPALALDPQRPVDRANVDIPVQSAFTGLDATVTIAVTRGAGAQPQQVSLTHDFFSSPILVLTAAQLAAG
jgi:hypothetical protein